MIPKMMGGPTSFQIAKLVFNIMDANEVSDDFIMVVHYGNVPSNKVTKDKYIYVAYDSETKVTDGTIWDEVKHFSNNMPHLILCVDKTSYKFYKKHRLPVAYMPMGYDDLNYKKITTPRVHGVTFIGSADIERNSIFNLRHIYFKELWKRRKGFFPNFDNNLDYLKINKAYSKTVIGLNDIILGINQRCFEIPVNGAYMLVNKQIKARINKDYPLKENIHYTVFDDVTDMLQKANKLLNDRDNTIKKGERAKKEALKHPFSKGVIKVIDEWKLR